MTERAVEWDDSVLEEARGTLVQQPVKFYMNHHRNGAEARVPFLLTDWLASLLVVRFNIRHCIHHHY